MTDKKGRGTSSRLRVPCFCSTNSIGVSVPILELRPNEVLIVAPLDDLARFGQAENACSFQALA